MFDVSLIHPMRLPRALNRNLVRRRRCYLTTRTDRRRWTPPNHLAIACRALAKYVRERQRLAREQPHLYGPHADRYRRDTVAMMRSDAEAETALRKVYGPHQPGESSSRPDAWTRRYVLSPQWRGFRKWFRESYGP